MHWDGAALNEGTTDGLEVGFTLRDGLFDGVGDGFGLSVGKTVGRVVGEGVGLSQVPNGLLMLNKTQVRPAQQESPLASQDEPSIAQVVGRGVGLIVGNEVGLDDGAFVGKVVGEEVGELEGTSHVPNVKEAEPKATHVRPGQQELPPRLQGDASVAQLVGRGVGLEDGKADGLVEGTGVGADVGKLDGLNEIDGM